MKRMIYILPILCLIFLLYSCSKNDKVFTSTVLENNSALIVEPQKDNVEHESSDKIVVHTNEAVILNKEGLKIELKEIVVGQTVKITYNGMMAESYPPQIWASKIKVVE